MSKNSIQFQKELSLPEFLEKYGSERQRYEALFKLRRPQGFVYPDCGNTTHCRNKSRKVHQCNRCHRQISITAGTIFESTKLPLALWFQRIYLMTQDTRL